MTDPAHTPRVLITWEDDTQSMSFDALLQEGFSRSADITSFPVEDGSVVSDHVQPQQPTLSLQVHVTDTPVRAPEDHVDTGVTGLVQSSPDFQAYLRQHPPPKPGFGLPSGRLFRNYAADRTSQRVASANVLVFTGGRLNRTVNIFDQLDLLLEQSTVLRVHGHFRHFDNMVITSLETTRDASSGSGLSINIELVQVQFAQSSDISGGTRPRNPKHRQAADAGGEAEPVPETEKDSTILNEIIQFGRSAFRSAPTPPASLAP